LKQLSDYRSHVAVEEAAARSAQQEAEALATYKKARIKQLIEPAAELTRLALEPAMIDFSSEQPHHSEPNGALGYVARKSYGAKEAYALVILMPSREELILRARPYGMIKPLKERSLDLRSTTSERLSIAFKEIIIAVQREEGWADHNDDD